MGKYTPAVQVAAQLPQAIQVWMSGSFFINLFNNWGLCLSKSMQALSMRE
jgi:hypothetical protein